MALRPPRLPQRIRHYDGERLRAADLRDTVEDAEHLLRIHERAAHRGRRLGRPYLRMRQIKLPVQDKVIAISQGVGSLSFDMANDGFTDPTLPFFLAAESPWPSSAALVLISPLEVRQTWLQINVLVAAINPAGLITKFADLPNDHIDTLTLTWLGVERRPASVRRQGVAPPGAGGIAVEEQELAIEGPPAPERPAFFDGQQLLAADLNAVDAYVQALRWRHNRDMHGWGVAQGFAVQAQPGDRTVTITPGYAIDSVGRELLLSSACVLTVPAVAGPADYHICAIYAQDSDLPAEQRAGPYGSVGAVRRAEAPLLRWVPARELAPGVQLVLSTVQVRNCRVASLSESLRRSALPERSPYIATGVAQPGALSWTPFPQQGQLTGLQVVISTAEGGFLGVPQYSVQVVGSRDFGSGYIDGPIQILNPNPKGFTLQMLLPRNLPLGVNGAKVLNPLALLSPASIGGQIAEINRRWTIFWMGIEAG